MIWVQINYKNHVIEFKYSNKIKLLWHFLLDIIHLVDYENSSFDPCQKLTSLKSLDEIQS